MLLGAWLLTQGNARQSLGQPAIRAMLALLDEPSEHERGRLWLATTSHVAIDAGNATLGFAAGDEGHYVRVRQAGDHLELSRSLSGGERLYLARHGDLVLFASSLRPLLAHPAIDRAVDPDVLADVLLTGHVTRGARTPVRGIDEVLPGHTATLGTQVEQEWHCAEALRSPVGTTSELARRFRDALTRAVERAVGRERPVALALSGGIDSSAVAAALVDVVGADAVHAFSYEFDDPTHSVETDFAKHVARRLGIQKHDVFPIHFKDFLDAIPEHVWRSESAVHWPKAFLLPVARHIRARGFDRYLTGFGIGSHMGWLRELTNVLPFIPLKDRTLRYWSRVRFDGWDFFQHLERIHPGLEPPHPRLFHLLVETLEARGLLSDRRRMYPPELAPLLRGARSPTTRPLRQELEREAIAHLVSCIDVTRSEKASREAGALRISPAHFTSCIPYAYFPPLPAPRVWTADRRLRPGKLLLREAYRGILPDEVLFRKKSWDDAVVSRAWRKRGRVFMLRALPHHPSDFDRIAPGFARAIEHWEPMSIQASCLALRLWLELFVHRPPSTEPPTWEELWGRPPASYRDLRAIPLEAIR